LRRYAAALIGHRYSVRLARTREDVEAALRLRFEVFNLELHEGLTESFFTGLDEDEFDRVCEHLIVIDEYGKRRWNLPYADGRNGTTKRSRILQCPRVRLHPLRANLESPD
jgi:hypothetical protein